MPIRIQCDQCQAVYNVPDAQAGKVGQCKCGNTIPIPSPGQAAPPPPPRPASMIEDGADDLTSGPVDASAPIYDEDAAAIPGGVTCPKCRMVSKPGASCEWCSAELVPAPAASAATAAPSVTGSVGPLGVKAAPGPARSVGVPATGEIPALEVIAEAFRFVFRYPGLIFGSMAVVMLCTVPLVLVMQMLQVKLFMTGVFGGMMMSPLTIAGALIAYFVVLLSLTPLLNGPFYIMDSLLAKGRAELGLLVRGYTASFWSIVGASALLAVIFGIMGGLQSVVFQIMARAGRGALLSAFLGFLAVQICLEICLLFTSLEIVDKRAGAFGALAGSWEATEGYRGSIFVVLFILGLGALALAIGTLMPIGFLLGRQGSMVVAMLFDAPVILIIAAVSAATTIIMYRNLRGLEAASV